MGECRYVAEVKTSNEGGSGTDDDVLLSIASYTKVLDGNGKEKWSNEVKLADWNLDTDNDDFETGAVNKFYREDIYFANIDRISLEIVPNGTNVTPSSAWKVEYVKIIRTYAGESTSFIFPINTWMGIEERDPSQNDLKAIVIADKTGVICHYKKVMTDDLNLNMKTAFENCK
ncbi:hypothetical protein [Cohnella herbarum]|uniref:PLAT domain-containing protein n=1 Tax=Cohnella herbarum TaxID=2728023 RepID=A0A7Z2VIA9_9BACL|nr:hypothetical protein [Cohnella herbarum]QJD83547.1 hypothetical protein HH215_10395 [Cohnella herbarum]